LQAWAPRFIRDWIKIIKTEGIKSFVKQKGWKVVLLIVLYYLVRDSILYIIIPYLIINNIIQCQ